MKYGTERLASGCESLFKIEEGDTVRCYGGEYCQGTWEYSEVLIASPQTKFSIEESEYVYIVNHQLP